MCERIVEALETVYYVLYALSSTKRSGAKKCETHHALAASSAKRQGKNTVKHHALFGTTHVAANAVFLQIGATHIY
jgi:hypothetical protein